MVHVIATSQLLPVTRLSSPWQHGLVQSSAHALLLLKSHPGTQLESALQKSGESFRHAPWGWRPHRQYLLKASMSTLSGFYHNFYKAHPITKHRWTCRETAQSSYFLTQLLILDPKLWEGTRFFSGKLVAESAP